MAKEGFEKLRKNNTIDCLYPYILKILSEKPVHAYILRKEIEKRFSFRPGSVTAYRVLYLLKKSGLVKKTQNGRTKIYTITQKGKQELKNAVNFYRDLASSLE